MQPPQTADDTGNAVASRPRYQYTEADLQTLHEIVSLATVFPGKSSFRAIWRAYDVVLAARKINPALDSVYFRFILQLQGIEGRGIYDRFMVLLDRLGIDVSQWNFLETPAATTEFTRQRYEDARQRRDLSSGRFPVLFDESYQAENEAARTSSHQSRRPTRKPRSANTGTNSSPTREAVVAAELAARNRRDEVRRRRERTIVAPEQAQESTEDEEVEDIPRTRVPPDAADELYNIRMKAIMRECLHHWHALTVKRVVRHEYLEQIATRLDRRVLLEQGLKCWQEERWFAVVADRAERYYNTTLATKVWRVWVQRTAAIVQRTYEVRQRILMRKYFNAWRTIVVENEEKIRLFQLSNALLKWRERTREQTHRLAVAHTVFASNLAHRAYWTWFFQLCGILGARRYRRRLCEGGFDVWVERTERVIQMNRMADAFYRRRTLQVIFNHWSERTLICLEQQTASEDHEEWKLTQRTFDNWRRSAKLAPVVEAIGYSIDNRVMVNFVALWRRRTQQAHISETITRLKTLKSGLKTWRLSLRKKILEDQANERLQMSILHNWVLQTRLHTFQHYQAVDLCRNTLIHWSYHRYTLVRKLETVAKQVVALRNHHTASQLLTGLKGRLQFRQQEAIEAQVHHNLRVVSRALRTWYTKVQRAQFIRRLENTAAAVRHRSLINQAFKRWHLKAGLCRIYDDWAEDAIYYFTVRRTLHLWKAAHKSRQRDHLREAFHTQARKTKRNLATRVLGHWLAQTNHIQQLNHTAQQLTQRRVEGIAVESILIWRLQAEEITALHTMAEDYNRARLLRSCLELWSDYAHFIRGMNEEAEILHAAQNNRIASKYLRIWETAGWHLNTKRMIGVRFEKRRYRDILKGWRNAAQEKIQRRAWLQGRGIDETIDEGFGAEWVQPLSVGRAPTSVRAPVSTPAEDLGRSVLGRSLFRQTVRGGGDLRKAVLGQSVAGTPVGASLLLQTPSWRTGRGPRLSSTPAGVPMTPRNAMTPGSPLMRFSNRIGRLGGLDESQYE